MNILIISDSLFFQEDVVPQLTTRHTITLMTSDEVDFGSLDSFAAHEVIWSFHCKKLFPAELCSSKRCINIHPGYNPFNRGHAPHVFSIVNGLPCGVTVHLIDETVDNGAIMFRTEIEVLPHDTSGSLYERILAEEKRILLARFDEFTEWDGEFEDPGGKGNINSRTSFTALGRLDMEHVGTLAEHLALLRSQTHDPFQNAYFMDGDRRVFVSVRLDPETQ